MGRGNHHPIPDLEGRSLVRKNGCVLVGAEENIRTLNRWVAVVHAKRLEPDIADSPAFRRDRDNGRYYLERLNEGESESGVRGIH